MTRPLLLLTVVLSRFIDREAGHQPIQLPTEKRSVFDAMPQTGIASLAAKPLKMRMGIVRNFAKSLMN